MRVELYNDYHKTSVRLNLLNGDISNGQIARVRRLCPEKGYCPCNRWYKLYDTAFLNLIENEQRKLEEEEADE